MLHNKTNEGFTVCYVRGRRYYLDTLGKDAKHGGYENLWFSRLNLVETFSKHSLHINNIVFVA